MRLRGSAASPGVAIARAFLLNVEEIRVSERHLSSDDEVELEIGRFHSALEDTRSELQAISERLGDVIEGRQLIEVHILLLNDPAIISDVERRIREELVNAEYAVSKVLYDVLERFRSIPDPYLRSREVDIRDVGRRVMANLMGTEKEVLSSVTEPVVLVARDLDPSQTAGLSRRQLAGIATDLGGTTSHTAILARSLGIPSVVALRNVAENVRPGSTVIVDGIHGDVILDPDPDELRYYRELKKTYNSAEAEIALDAEKPAMTADGVTLELGANIEFYQEAGNVRKLGGEGIGLFRTEFLMLLAPEEQDQESVHYMAYRHVLEAVSPAPVIIRTLDIGGDKFMDLTGTGERNPFLGWRAIRIYFERPEVFDPQFRAMLRAAPHGDVRIMLPMIISVDEVTAMREHLESLRRDLLEEGEEIGGMPPLGIMVETPAAASIIDMLLPYVDFVSIGTNDLTQYTLAVDRGNPYVSHLFEPLHPSVLRQIDRVAGACRAAGKWVGTCGQMASEPLSIPLLVGFGLDELSVPVTLIPDVKKMISVVRRDEAVELCRRALASETAEDVRNLVFEYVRDRYPPIILDEICQNYGTCEGGQDARDNPGGG